MPGNAVLPTHRGMIITRGLEEWACLLSQDLSFSTAQRLLGWQTQEPEILSTTELRHLVREHGQLIRVQETAEVKELMARSDPSGRAPRGTLSGLEPRLVPAQRPRRQAAWPAELNAAVEAQLSAEQPQPPEGVSAQDWERVLAARQAEQTLDVATLARRGPEIQPGQVVVAPDEVKVRQSAKGSWWELRTARVATAQGYRYMSGIGDTFLRQLYLLIVLCGGMRGLVTLLCDGARWIRAFFDEYLAHLPFKEFVLDWYHLKKKCYELTSMICRGRKAKAKLLSALLFSLWRGDVNAALQRLEAYRPEAKNEAKLDELRAYIQSRRFAIPNYKARRRERQFNGSGHGEKADDLLVARRQKHKGMHWSLATSDALVALKTLMLNHGWDLYWEKRKVLPLVAT